MTAVHVPSRKKQLGQYFTGRPVARLLAALAQAEKAKTIIDPMVGRGDMLRACLEVGAEPSRLFGIDIDPIAVDAARRELANVLPSPSLICGDAFSSVLPDEQFDLVITNPPYIRYQRGSDGLGMLVPDGPSIRSNLLRALEDRRDLSSSAMNLFRVAALSYPGTADVAVPAWILAAALVAEHGTLAVVVPDAWLRRDYATGVRRMLDQAFETEFLIEDGDASWFEDALVRARLLVCHRRKVGGTRRGTSRIVVARTTRDLIREGRLIGDLGSEKSVALALSRCSSPSPARVTTGLHAHLGHTQNAVAESMSIRVSVDIARLLDGKGDLPVQTLSSYGWRTGQGLRTGANEFFYVLEESAGSGTVTTAPRWGPRGFAIPTECLLPAIRWQRDLGGYAHIESGALPHRLLFLRGWITHQDFASSVAAGTSKEWLAARYRLLPEDVGEWIHAVADAPATYGDTEKHFRELSAVRVNERAGRAGEPLSFWYHLPPLAPRHSPELLIPRVCGGRPYACSNAGAAVVDANFATLWTISPKALDADALLAFLNSTWVRANLERNCTVLGGGALKVEATDLRKLPFPTLDPSSTESLTRLGRRLQGRHDDGVLDEIDWVLAPVLFGRVEADRLSRALRKIADQALAHRTAT